MFKVCEGLHEVVFFFFMDGAKPKQPNLTQTLPQTLNLSPLTG